MVLIGRFCLENVNGLSDFGNLDNSLLKFGVVDNSIDFFIVRILRVEFLDFLWIGGLSFGYRY